MAEEVLIKLWCDPCLKEDGERTDATAYELNGMRVDLCDRHGAAVQRALETVQTYGRKSAKPKAAQMAPVAPAKPRRPNLTDEEKTEMVRRRKAGERVIDIAADFNVVTSAVQRAVNGAVR